MQTWVKILWLMTYVAMHEGKGARVGLRLLKQPPQRTVSEFYKDHLRSFWRRWSSDLSSSTRPCLWSILLLRNAATLGIKLDPFCPWRTVTRSQQNHGDKQEPSKPKGKGGGASRSELTQVLWRVFQRKGVDATWCDTPLPSACAWTDSFR